MYWQNTINIYNDYVNIFYIVNIYIMTTKITAKDFFDQKSRERESSRNFIKTKTEIDRKIIWDALKNWLKIKKIDVSPWSKINEVIKEQIEEMSKELLNNWMNFDKVSPIKFNFNGVDVLMHPNEIKDQGIEFDEYVNKKYAEREQWMGLYNFGKSITQKYIKIKNDEKESLERQKKEQEILEKENTLWGLEFSPKKAIDCSKIPPELQTKYWLKLWIKLDWDDRILNQMAMVDGETLRNIWLERNTDWYWAAIYSYAQRRAKLMQDEINKWAKLNDIADELSHDADIEWITWFMYWAAVRVLSGCRKYGEDLRKRHNKEYNHEWSWVVNPALITVSNK